jgi:hypothetical protein
MTEEEEEKAFQEAWENDKSYVTSVGYLASVARDLADIPDEMTKDGYRVAMKAVADILLAVSAAGHLMRDVAGDEFAEAAARRLLALRPDRT